MAWTLENYREWLRYSMDRPDLAVLPDEMIHSALIEARKWVGDRKYSDAFVALSILTDGYPHA